GKGVFPCGLRVVVGEVVDQLFDADRVTRRQLAVAQEAPDVAVGGAVDVDAEGGERVRRDGEKRILGDGRVFLGVESPLLLVQERGRRRRRHGLRLEAVHDRGGRDLPLRAAGQDQDRQDGEARCPDESYRT